MHEQRIHHGGLIDNAEIAGERIGSVLPEAPLARRKLQQPVDCPGLAACRLAHPARRTASGRGQLDPKLPPLADRQEALQHRGLPRARPSRDHREPAAEGGAQALDLTGSQGDTERGLGLSDFRVDLRPLIALPMGSPRAGYAKKAFGRARLCRAVFGKVDGAVALRAGGRALNDKLPLAAHGLKGSRNDAPVCLQQRLGFLDETVERKTDIAFLRALAQAVEDPRANSPRRIRREAQAAGDVISGLEAHAGDLARQPEGILLRDDKRFLPVAPSHPDHLGFAQTQRAQLLYGLLLCVHQIALQRHQHTLAAPVAQESRKKTEAISYLTYICKNVSMYV